MGRQWLHAKRLVAGLKKGRTTSKIVREISVSAKMGGADPDSNARLAAAIEKARKDSVSRDVIERTINSMAQKTFFDTLGRVSGYTNMLGTFTRGYSGDTHRMTSLAYPNGQTTTYDYFGGTGDRRLKQIWNKKSGGATLSKFDYEYDVLGRITDWTRQADAATPQVWSMDYDFEDQLLAAAVTQSGSGVKGFAYGYDDMGNRTSEELGVISPSRVSTVTKSSYNSVNQLTSRTGTGPLPVRFEGKINEPGTVTVNGQAAKMTQDGDSMSNGKIFNKTLDLPTGNNSVAVVAKDLGNNGQGNTSTNNYSVTVASGAAKTFTWDNNGNCTGYTCGSTNVTYQWDAEDRLVVISDNQGNSSTFTYDGLSRRVKEDIYMSGEFATTLRFLWSGKELCEERDSGGGTVTKRFFADGEFVSGNKVFFAKDHLGSVREVMSSNGTTILSRYDYDPYGRRTKVGGFFNYGDFGFTGHYYHAASGLYLALYRAYDADTGRWLNRDPIGEAGGLNLYGYVRNTPVNAIDPFGLDDTARGALLEELGETEVQRKGREWRDGFVDGAKNAVDLLPQNDFSEAVLGESLSGEEVSDGGRAAAGVGLFAGLLGKLKKLCKLIKGRKGADWARKHANDPNVRKAFSYDPKTGKTHYAENHSPEMSQPGMVMGEYKNGEPLIYRGGSAAEDAAAQGAVIRDLEPPN